MSDDIFIREVNEEMRQDRARQVWARFGRWIIAGAVLVLLATVAFVLYQRWELARANASGDSYLAAGDLAATSLDEALAAFESLAADGYGAYPDLARLRIAAIRGEEGDARGAVAAFDAVANESGAPQPVRDIAAVRAAYLLVDAGTRADVSARVERLSGDAAPLRFPAREALALAAWKEGDRDSARTLFQQLVDDPQTPQGLGERARLMLDVIAGGDPSSAEPVRAPAPAPAAAAPAPAPEAEAAPGPAAPAPAAPVEPAPAE